MIYMDTPSQKKPDCGPAVPPASFIYVCMCANYSSDICAQRPKQRPGGAVSPGAGSDKDVLIDESKVTAHDSCPPQRGTQKHAHMHED